MWGGQGALGTSNRVGGERSEPERAMGSCKVAGGFGCEHRDRGREIRAGGNGVTRSWEDAGCGCHCGWWVDAEPMGGMRCGHRRDRVGGIEW